MKRFLYQQINPEIYYNKLLHDYITTTDKKADERKINNITRDAKKIAIDLDLENRTEMIIIITTTIIVKSLFAIG